MDFVKEGKLDEERKRRQAEWERVRSKEDPVEAPAEVFDNRTLYDKLKEQNDIKKKEFEDQYSLKNQVRGVDGDEVHFLNECDRVRLQREKEIRMEERKELEQVKKAAQIASPDSVPKIVVTLPTNKKENKQAELLAHAIKRKSSQPGSASSTLIKLANTSFEKITSDSTRKTSSKLHLNKENESSSDGSSESGSGDESDTRGRKKLKEEPKSTAAVSVRASQIVAGILPGLGDYDSDSSSVSENSTDDDHDENEGSLNTHALLNRKSSDISAAAKLTKL